MEEFEDPLYIRTTVDGITRNAIWNYMLEHSSIDKKTQTLKIFINCKNRKDFWRRIEYRFGENYHNKRGRKIELKISQLHKIQDKIDSVNKYNCLRINEIEKGNNILLKVELYIYRKIKNHLFKKY